MLPYKSDETYTHQNSPPVCSPLFPGHPYPKLADASLRSTLEESCTKISFLRHKISKAGSNEVSPCPSLSIKKEVLKPKASSRCRPVHKHFKIQVKQKTDCFNRIYEKVRGKSKHLIDWIRFNITYGIYVLWGRIRKHFDLARQIVQQPQGRPAQRARISKINQNIIKLLNFKGLQTLSTFSSFMRKRRTSNNKSDKQNFNCKIRELKGRSPENKLAASSVKHAIDRNSPHERVQQSVTSNSVDLQAIQRVLSQFSSTICLIENELTLQGTLASRDNANKSQANSSPCIEQIKKLQEILMNNHQRCSIIKQLFQKLSSLDHLEAESPSNGCTQQFLEEDEDCHTNKVEDFEEMEDSQIESAISKVWEERSRAPSRTLTRKNCILLSKKTTKAIFENNGENPKKVVRIVDEGGEKHRASIELRIDESGHASRATPKAISFSRLKSKSSIKFKQSINSINKVSIEGEKRKNSGISHASYRLASRKNIANREEGKKQGKVIAFSKDVNVRRDHSVSRKNILKSTCKKGKSRKDVSISEIEGVSFKSMRGIKSMKSILSMKSARSITSNNTINSKQMIKSMRTQRQIKFLRGKLKKVTCVRSYKDKLFKMNSISDFDEEGKLKVTEAHFQTAIQQKISLKHLIAHRQEINHHLKTVQKKYDKNTDSQDPHIPTNNRQFILKRNRPGNNAPETLQKSKKITIDITPHKQSEIESWKLKKQSIFLHLLKLFKDRTITQEQLSCYKAILARRLEGPEKTIQDEYELQGERDLRSGTESPYRCLLGLTREIEGNVQLNQINKYYYNLSQFSKEEEEINKTKQTSKKDQQFFNMKVFTESRKNIKLFRPPVSNPPLFKHLCQKDL